MSAFVSALIESIPYIQRFRDKTVVIKLGGSLADSPEGRRAILQDIVLLSLVGMKIVLVHGGGKEISARLDRMGIESEFVGGYRVTGDAAITEVEMVLTGRINTELTLLLNNGGIKAVGISGKDGGWLKATKKWVADGDIGHVGEVANVDPTLINLLMSGGYTPVISPIGHDREGKTFNLNADDVASAVATAVGAEKLILMTDVDGIYKNYPDPESFVSKLNLDEAKALLQIVKGGMIPKLTCAVNALENGVHSVHLLNGSTPHSLLVEVFSDSGIGTMIEK